MCSNPQTINNPIMGRKYFSYQGDFVESPSNYYSHKNKVTVPCGKCAECRNRYFQSIFQRAVVEAQNAYLYFISLTYDNEHLPIVKIGGKDFYFANYSHIQELFKRLRNQNIIDRDFRYLSVNEYGSDYGRPHFHILLFVSKLSNDTLITPLNIESTLFKNVGPLFAVNKGSRKNPIYEQLFTYHTSWVNGQFRTNYFVKYVDLSHSSGDTLFKTINYLISYVNKPNKVSQQVDQILSSYTDLSVVKLVRNRLSSKVRYSKGFGLGFDSQGFKVRSQRSLLSISTNEILFAQLKDSLPPDFDTFKSSYPSLYNDLQHWLVNLDLSLFSDFNDYIASLDIITLQLFYIAVLYKLPQIDQFRSLSSYRLTPTIFYHYRFLDSYKYTPIYKTTGTYTDSFASQYIRRSIEFGIQNCYPFITFIYGQNVQPLCNFYKNLFMHLDDIQRMYDSLGVSNYDQWLSLFQKYVNDKKSTLQLSNVVKTEKNSENICFSQKQYLHLTQEKINLYTFLTI